jgi:hypothetical protein
MKKITLLVGIGLLAAACSAQAQYFGVSIGHHGVSVGVGASVCSVPPAVVSAPAPVYYPAPAPGYYSTPVYTAPQPYYTQPPVVYTPPPVCAPAPVYAPGYYGYGPSVVIGGGYGGWHHGYRGHWEHRGWRR